MVSQPTQSRFKSPAIAVFISLILALLLTKAVWNINLWPTDACYYYRYFATELPQYKYISQMHEGLDSELVRWLHGKEIFIILSSILQEFMHDVQTLRPLILICIASLMASSILVFLIARNWLGERVAWICYFLFTTSFWPYVYVLFVKHQPLGLFFVLLSIYLVQISRRKMLWFLAGLSFGLALFSSPTASVYAPWIVAAAVWKLKKDGWKLKWILGAVALFAAAFIVPVIGVNFPNILENIGKYWDYVQISSSHNHFYFNQLILRQWIEHPELSPRGGWVWVFKYFFIAMPVVFSAFLVLMSAALANKIKPAKVVGIFLLCIAPAILAELKGVAQYGGNYFPSFVGIIGGVGWALRQIQWRNAFVLVFAAHFVVNGYIWWTDVYPTRMVTTRVSEFLEKNKIYSIATYAKHRHKEFTVDQLSPLLKEKLEIVSIKNIMQPRQGVIFLPPATGDSLYIAMTSTYSDFDEDIYLNELLTKGNLGDYAIASFKTIASSRIWLHEEEILSYRNLILGHKFDFSSDKTKVLLLDAQKLRRDLSKNIPRQEFFDLITQGMRLIGAESSIYRFHGLVEDVTAARTIGRMEFPIIKKGSPQDSLQLFVYRLNKELKIWTPYAQSKELVAAQVPEEVSSVYFLFNPPVDLKEGTYNYIIYRTGSQNDGNSYAIYNYNLQEIKQYMETTCQDGACRR